MLCKWRYNELQSEKEAPGLCPPFSLTVMFILSFPLTSFPERTLEIPVLLASLPRARRETPFFPAGLAGAPVCAGTAIFNPVLPGVLGTAGFSLYSARG